MSGKFTLDTSVTRYRKKVVLGSIVFFSSFVICVLSQMADTTCVSVDSGLIPSPIKSETLT